MLPCQNVGGYHQGALFACSAHGEHREHGDDGLATADIPLQQRMELLFPVEPCDNLVQCVLLPVGELEGECCARLHDAAQVDLPFVTAHHLVLPPADHAQAERHEFQNLEFALGLADGGEVRGVVQHPQVVEDRCKVQVIRELARADSGECEARELEHGGVQLPKKFLLHPRFAAGFADGVDREDAPVKFFAFVEGLHVGVRDLQASVVADGARHEPVRIRLDFLAPEVACLEEQKRNLAGAVGKRRNEPRCSPAHDAGTPHGANQHDFLADFAVCDFGNLCLVQVGAGNVVEQVADGEYSRLVQGF